MYYGNNRCGGGVMQVREAMNRNAPKIHDNATIEMYAEEA